MFNFLLLSALVFGGYAVYKYYKQDPTKEMIDPVAKIGGSIVATAGSLFAWALAYLGGHVTLPF